MRPSPPDWAERLLRTCLPDDVVGESILGDAREEFAEQVERHGRVRAGLWYAGHAARLGGTYVLRDWKRMSNLGGGVDVSVLWKDLKAGMRGVLRMPGSAAISVVVLALGIGLCTSMFSVVYGLYFRGLDAPEADRLMMVLTTDVERGFDRQSVPIQDFVDFEERQTSFEGLGAYSGGTVNLSGPDGTPRRYSGTFASADLLRIVAVQPMLGRTFQDGEDLPGAVPNVVLGFDAWRDHYGSDGDVVGTDVRVNGEPATIIGVMPDGFEFPDNTELWIPNRIDPLASERAQGGWVQVVGRLAPGVERAAAELEFERLAAQLEQEYPVANDGRGSRLLSVVEANMDEQLNLIFGTMMIAVLCVLLVACANVANLLLARAAVRTKEAGVRVAMGGGRLRVMMPFFAESLVLALMGAALGVGIAYVAVDWFDTVTDPSLTGRPYFMEFVIDWPILVFVVGLALLTAVVAGLAPAFQVSKTDVGTVLKDQSRGSSSLALGRLSRVLVSAEVALSCALLVGAGLMTKSMVKFSQVEFLYETDRLLTARVGLFEADYPDRDSRQHLWEDLRVELSSMPQVAAAGLTDRLPYAGNFAQPVAFLGETYEADSDYPGANRAIASVGYFESLGVSVVSGRDFRASDDMNGEHVAIVNQPFVDRHLGGRDPIGLQFREGVPDTVPYLTIVGVVPDLDMQGATPRGAPNYEPAGYYVPLTQADARFLSLAALVQAGDGAAITGDVRALVRGLDPELPIYDAWTQAEVIHRNSWFYSTFGTVFIVFGLSALFMASVGLYGVLSFAVSRRTQEMGIRMALGAGAREVVGLVARQGAAQLGVGLGVGMLMAYGLTRLIGLFMYDVDPQDPLVFGVVFLTILVVGMAAAVIPALRASGVSPVVALRSD